MSYDYQDEALRDFRAFLYLVWDELGLPDPTPVQYDIAQFLQHGPRRRMVQAFRGVGKSWITSAYVLWRLYWNPAENILVVSASKERADAFSIFTQRLIRDIEWLNPLMPREEDGQRRSMVAFDVGPAGASHAPSVKSVGITGQMTGSRADCLIADDVESLSNSDTQLKRDKLGEVVKEFDAILKPNGSVVYLGTPQTEESIYKYLPERGYSIRVWPARYPRPDKVASYGGANRELAPRIMDSLMTDEGYQTELEWQPTDPSRFNEMELIEREASYGRAGFALQFQLDTSLSDTERYPLKARDLIVMPLDPETAPERVVWSGDIKQRIKELECVGMAGDGFQRPYSTDGSPGEYRYSIMAVDPAGRGKDDTAVCVIKERLGKLYVTAWEAFPGGYDTPTLQKIATIAKEHGVHKIIVESNFGDGMFNSLLEPVLSRIYPVELEEVRHSKQKERRIADVLEPVLGAHALILDEQVARKDYETRGDLPFEERLRRMGIYQMTRLTRQKGALVHDDKLDALSMAVAAHQDALKIDETKAIERLRDAEWDDAMESLFREPLSGPQRRGKTWMDSMLG